MALNTLNCNHLMPLPFKGLTAIFPVLHETASCLLNSWEQTIHSTDVLLDDQSTY